MFGITEKNFNLIFTIWMVRTIPLILHYFSQLRNSNNIVFVVLAACEHLVNTLTQIIRKDLTKTVVGQITDCYDSP